MGHFLYGMIDAFQGPKKRGGGSPEEPSQRREKGVFSARAKNGKKRKIMCFFVYTTTIFKV
jgi:hypothetical protein